MGFLATVPQGLPLFFIALYVSAVHVALQNISKIGDALFTETALRIAHEVKMEGNAFDPFVYELVRFPRFLPFQFIRNKNVEMKVYLELCNALRFIIRYVQLWSYYFWQVFYLLQWSEAHREELEGKEFAKIVSRNTDISDEHALILMKGYNLTVCWFILVNINGQSPFNFSLFYCNYCRCSFLMKIGDVVFFSNDTELGGGWRGTCQVWGGRIGWFGSSTEHSILLTLDKGNPSYPFVFLFKFFLPLSMTIMIAASSYIFFSFTHCILWPFRFHPTFSLECAIVAMNVKT